MNFQELKMKAVYLNGQVNSIKRSLQDNLIQHSQAEAELSQLRRKETTLQDAIEKFKLIVEKFSSDHIKEIEGLVTLALRTVFYDREYSFKIEVSDKRNAKYADLYLIDGEVEVPLYQGQVAGGILSVIGLILQIYSLSYLSLAPVLFLDEALSQISTQYLPGLFELIEKIKEKTGLIIVLVTHDPRMSEYASRIYEVDSGTFTLLSREEHE